nr:hypothetical protein [Sporocytophaga sp.]
MAMTFDSPVGTLHWFSVFLPQATTVLSDFIARQWLFTAAIFLNPG